MFNLSDIYHKQIYLTSNKLQSTYTSEWSPKEGNLNNYR